jgi:hypothetical protein
LAFNPSRENPISRNCLVRAQRALIEWIGEHQFRSGTRHAS